jgi:hypothetical protein|tara:strand:+ start:3476 stop:3583 length:108 start_codon:yes stop_codon:yes gene_type:complete
MMEEREQIVLDLTGKSDINRGSKTDSIVPARRERE